MRVGKASTVGIPPGFYYVKWNDGSKSFYPSQKDAMTAMKREKRLNKQDSKYS